MDQKIMRPKPFALWLQGPTSAGKTTLAEHFVARRREFGHPVLHFDGDEIRDLFGSQHGFNPGDRLRVVQALVHFANKSVNSGLDVVISALTAHEESREYVAANVINLISGYVRCPIPVCAERDPKGLYELAANGEIDTLIGVNTEYVPPLAPDIILDTESNDLDDLVETLERHLI